MGERELAVFFRNSHFGTLLKCQDDLFLLCTDVGFMTEEAVWERLDVVDGDTTYLNSDFRPLGSGPARPARCAGECRRARCPGCNTINEIPDTSPQTPVFCVACGACGVKYAFATGSGPTLAQQACSQCGIINQF